MGYDTLVDGQKLGEELTTIAKAIRIKGARDGEIEFKDFATRIHALPEDELDHLLRGVLISYQNDKVTQLPMRIFEGQERLAWVSLQKVTTVGQRAFYGCTNLSSLSMPAVTSVGTSAFYNCKKLSRFVAKAAIESGITGSAFRGCSNLVRADFTEINKNRGILSGAFEGCEQLTALIIRNSDAPPKLITTAFNNTPIANGYGYIYVSDSLVETYKAATNWSAFAEQIKPLKELPAY